MLMWSGPFEWQPAHLAMRSNARSVSSERKRAPRVREQALSLIKLTAYKTRLSLYHSTRLCVCVCVWVNEWRLIEGMVPCECFLLSVLSVALGLRSICCLYVAVMLVAGHSRAAETAFCLCRKQVKCVCEDESSLLFSLCYDTKVPASWTLAVPTGMCFSIRHDEGFVAFWRDAFMLMLLH